MDLISSFSAKKWWPKKVNTKIIVTWMFTCVICFKFHNVSINHPSWYIPTQTPISSFDTQYQVYQWYKIRLSLLIYCYEFLMYSHENIHMVYKALWSKALTPHLSFSCLFCDLMNCTCKIVHVFRCYPSHWNSTIFSQVYTEFFGNSFNLKTKWEINKPYTLCYTILKLPVLVLNLCSKTCQFDWWYVPSSDLNLLSSNFLVT